MRLYLSQVVAIRYLCLDVAGFTLGYVAAFLYAFVFVRSQRWLFYLGVVSIDLFIANVPFLWVAPNLAVLLMALSVIAFAAVPVALARLATT